MPNGAALGPSFAYRALTPQGLPISGSIEAADHDSAQRLLAGMQLKVTQIEQLDRPPRGASLRSGDLLAFNQQLAQLTAAGLPVERGLRLIAQEARNPRVRAAIEHVAAEAERGKPLGEAFAACRGQFPPLYAQLVEAGVRTNDLSGMLFNLGRHMEVVNNLRAVIWRTVAYPCIVLVVLLGLIFFVSCYVLPDLSNTISGFYTGALPFPTWILLQIGPWALPALGLVLVLLLAAPLMWRVLRTRGQDQFVTDALGLPMPLIGPVLRRGLISRWCDAVRLGLVGGLDLPAAMNLAGQAIASPSLEADSQRLAEALQAGGRLSDAKSLRLLPETVTTTMDLACEGRDLPSTMESLSRMYQEQAELRLSMVNAILMPILIICLAVIVGFVILAIFLPLTNLLGGMIW
jgi:type IV pilus assembly protein PilC